MVPMLHSETTGSRPGSSSSFYMKVAGGQADHSLAEALQEGHHESRERCWYEGPGLTPPTEQDMRFRPAQWPLPRPVAVHHIVEDFLTDWTAPVGHILPLRRFLENCLDTDLRSFYAGNQVHSREGGVDALMFECQYT